jgi:hypothetical protein
MRDNVRNSDQPPLLWWISVAFLILWATLLVHEGAHYLAAWLLFSPSDWAGTAAESWRQVWVWSAGPLASLSIVALSAAALTISHRPTIQRFALIASLSAASRLLVTAMPTLLGKPNDEHWINIVTRVPGSAIWGAEAVVTGLLVGWIFFRVGRVQTSAIGVSLVGIVLGWIAAFTFGRAIGLQI